MPLFRAGKEKSRLSTDFLISFMNRFYLIFLRSLVVLFSAPGCFVKGHVAPHRGFHLLRLIRPLLRLKIGGAVLEVQELRNLTVPLLGVGSDRCQSSTAFTRQRSPSEIYPHGVDKSGAAMRSNFGSDCRWQPQRLFREKD